MSVNVTIYTELYRACNYFEEYKEVLRTKNLRAISVEHMLHATVSQKFSGYVNCFCFCFLIG